MACSFVRAIPPTCRSICKTWGLEMSPAHYVLPTKWKKGDRLVLHLSKAADGEDTDQDVNSRSPDLGYGEVQADYIDTVVMQFVDFLRTDGGFSKQELVMMEADVKAAFKCVVIHLDSVGSMCMDFENWMYVLILGTLALLSDGSGQLILSRIMLKR